MTAIARPRRVGIAGVFPRNYCSECGRAASYRAALCLPCRKADRVARAMPIALPCECGEMIRPRSGACASCAAKFRWASERFGVPVCAECRERVAPGGGLCRLCASKPRNPWTDAAYRPDVAGEERARVRAGIDALIARVDADELTAAAITEFLDSLSFSPEPAPRTPPTPSASSNPYTDARPCAPTAQGPAGTVPAGVHLSIATGPRP